MFTKVSKDGATSDSNPISVEDEACDSIEAQIEEGATIQAAAAYGESGRLSMDSIQIQTSQKCEDSSNEVGQGEVGGVV